MNFYFTGEKVGELCGQTGRNCNHFDLDIDGDTLIIAKYDLDSIQCYELITE
jgi:hypothetical protein